MLDGRYRLERQLGGDLLGASYQAIRIADDRLVCARAYRVRSDAGPQVERRLASLRELDHPALPRRLDEFVVGDAKLPTQWLIDEHRVGTTLADAITAAPEHRVDVQQVVATLRQLAELFELLARRPSPIVHGGLTPHSILLPARGPARSEGIGPAGACLLDLGLGSELVRASSTRGLADSLGYSAPEQLYTEATPAADVWALAAMAVVALSGASLSSLRDSTASLRWRDRVEVPPSLADTLERMLEPNPVERLRAGEVARALAELELPECPDQRRQHHPWTASEADPRVTKSGPSGRRNAPGPEARELSRPGPKPGRTTIEAEAPIMRPDELSRELSQAHQVTVSLAQQQRSQLVVARVLVVLVAAIIAGLTTYIAIMLS